MEKIEKYTLENWLEMYKFEKKEIKKIKKGVPQNAQKKPRIWNNMGIWVLSGKTHGIEEVARRILLTDEKKETEEKDDKLKTVDIEITDDKLETFFNRNNSLNGLVLNKDNKYFEVLISNLKLEDTISKIEDNNSKITYSLSPISEDYAASLLHELLTRYTKDREKLRKISLIFYSYMGKQKMKIEKKESIPIDELINKYLYENTLDNLISSISLKIETNQEIGLEKLKNIINSFSFEYIYSKNKEIILSEDIYEAFGIKNKTISNETVSFHEKDVYIPLEYNSKLINFYRNGIKAEDPYIQYLSYYHILEYHYSQVFGRDSERNKLKSVLQRYVDSQSLKNKIGIELCNYYEERDVNFSSVPKIDWNIGDSLENIKERIYDIRNSLVHSKETEDFYEPWNDEHEETLKKEIPLIRAVAELIIKNTGENINLD